MPQEDINFTDYIASSIHDMKNSLMMQVSALEKIAMDCRLKGDTQTYKSLGVVVYEANRMNSNLIQLLGLYKFDQSIYPMDLAEQSVSDVIEQAVLQSKTLMEFKGITISVECDADCYWYIDRDLMTGILINALNNASQYTRDKIRVFARREGGLLELRVEDNGNGYPSSMLQDVVGDVHKGIRFSSGSTGLGFYFASRAARMHKNGERYGSLTIENGGAFGGGCFVVKLP